MRRQVAGWILGSVLLSSCSVGGGSLAVPGRETPAENPPVRSPVEEAPPTPAPTPTGTPTPAPTPPNISDAELRDVVERARATPAEGEGVVGSALHSHYEARRKFNARFVRALGFRVPKNFEVKQGDPAAEPLFLRFSDQVSESKPRGAVCVYQGDSHKDYVFSYCMTGEVFRKLQCGRQPFAPQCQYSSDLMKLEPGDVFRAAILRVAVKGSSPRVKRTEVKVEFPVESENAKFYCGMVVTGKYSFPSSYANCSGNDAKAALIVRGDHAEVEGGNGTLVAPSSPVGVLVLGKKVNIRRLNVAKGGNQGVAILAANSPELSIDDLIIEGREIGVDLVNSPRSSVGSKVIFSNIHGPKIRNR